MGNHKMKYKRNRKRLTHCKQGHEFNIDNVYTCPTTGRRRCKLCRRSGSAAGQTTYRRSERGKSLARANHLMKNYGISILQYEEMLQLQNNLCAICHRPETRLNSREGKTDKLVIDHNHTTNKCRKLLCHTCNVALGLLQENPDRMRAMATYIESFYPLEAQ